MQFLRTLLRKIFFVKINILLNNSVTRPIINYCYNSVGWKKRRIFTKHLKKPNKNFVWKVKLLNKKFILNPIDVSSELQFKLGLEYFNISPQICIIENFINQTIDPEKIYLDIGANQGMRSFTALSTGRKTIMFEPNTYLNEINEKRCVINNFENYKIEKMCVSSEIGEQEFYFSIDHSMSSLVKEVAVKKEILEIKVVKTITLDYYFKKMNFQEI